MAIFKRKAGGGGRLPYAARLALARSEGGAVAELLELVLEFVVEALGRRLPPRRPGVRPRTPEQDVEQVGELLGRDRVGAERARVLLQGEEARLRARAVLDHLPAAR